MITINELFSGLGAQIAAFKRLNIPCEVVGIFKGLFDDRF
jgi:hypothetical protein